MFETILDLIYPRRCPVCDEIIAPISFDKKGKIVTGQLIHPACHRKIKYVKGPTCLKCGKPLKDEFAEYCEDCARYRHEFTRGFSVFGYRSIAGSIYRFKYNGRQEYAEFYAMEVQRLLGKRLKKLGIEAIVPVPMYHKKQIKRGYNQAEILAKAISKRLEIPYYGNLIKRVTNTRPMKELDVRGRRNNLKKAFIIPENDVKFKCILIIDDIYTTGSTIDEIAHEFGMIGVKDIYFLTLAIGQTT
jgi:ComF family protein